MADDETFIPVVITDFPFRWSSGPTVNMFRSWSDGEDRADEALAFADEMVGKSSAYGTKNYCHVWVGAVRELNPRD